MALNTVSSDRLSTNVKNTNFTAAEKQDLTDDILPLTGQLGNRNILHNGSFIVHQRGGTSTAQGFHIDRWYAGHAAGTVTISQGTETSGTVYEKGLANYYRVTNTANSTTAGTYRYIRQAIEAQNLLKSGWNYKSASAKITLSFYVRSSVAQNFYGYLRLTDSPDSKYIFETGSLTANTWTKVTKEIPGYTSANIDNDNGSGMEVLIAPFWGTNFTASGVALNTWAAWDSGERAPDNATTWVGTNGATFDITGVQLEVGSVATEFEHRSFGQELLLCQRYYYAAFPLNSQGAAIAVVGEYATTFNFSVIQFPCTMRTAPTGEIVNGSNYIKLFNPLDTAGRGCASVTVGEATPQSSRLFYSSFASNFSSTTGSGGYSYVANNSFKLCFTAEL